MNERHYAIIVHGGAHRIEPADWEANKAGCRSAALVGFEILKQGGSALEAVEKAINLMEDNPIFDAGLGSYLNQDGVVQLDAGLMDGQNLRIGAVAAVEELKNPISLARYLLSCEHSFFAGKGAELFARQNGFSLCPNKELITQREYQRWLEYRRAENKDLVADEFERGNGTVGAVALDSLGNIVAGSSTGGTLFKPAGRIGDTPLPGCGYFADNKLGGASSTGHGESIIRVQLSRTAVDLAASLPAAAACRAAVAILHERTKGFGGVIMIDHRGQIGFAGNTPNMVVAYLSDDDPEPHVHI
jgi:L-asparaginase / beta-aspartyl-peptidase